MNQESMAQWRYELRVACQLGPGIAAFFPEMTMTFDVDQQETVMRGALPDQAALHEGWRIRDLGLTLVALRRVADGAGPPPGGPC